MTDISYLTVEEVCGILKVPRKWVYSQALRLKNPLPSYKIGGKRRFIRDEVEQWVKEGKHENC
jgi:excisionase family DNA binding protein